MNEKLVPKRRFKQFQEVDNWEQHKLIEIADYRNGKAHEQNIDASGEYIVINSKFVSTDGCVKKYSNELIEPLSIGEIAFVLSDVPNGKAIAKTFLVKKNNKYTLNQRVAAITPHEGIDSYFLCNLMNRNQYFLQYDNGVGQTNLSKSDVENFIGKYPLYEEQKKIGKFFATLDNLIASQQHKLNKIKALKSAYLSEMFPAVGERKPKRRFAGFTDDWEQFELGDISKITMGQSPNSINYTDNPNDYILVQGNADMKNGKVYPRVWTTQITKKADPGDLILSVRAPVGDVGKTDFPIVIGRGIASIKGNEFLFQTLSKMKINGYWNKMSTGSTFDSINSEDIKNAIVMIPTINEQKKIGEFFANLDKLITSQQQKLDKLQNMKKAYLNEMFI